VALPRLIRELLISSRLTAARLTIDVLASRVLAGCETCPAFVQHVCTFLSVSVTTTTNYVTNCVGSRLVCRIQSLKRCLAAWQEEETRSPKQLWATSERGSNETAFRGKERERERERKIEKDPNTQNVRENNATSFERLRH